MPVVEERLTLLEGKMQEVGVTLVRIETTLGSLHQLVLRLEQRIDKLDQRVDKLDDRVVRLFLWVIGIQMTTLIAIVAGLFGIVTRLI
jgi:predicted nuclease with TOPRIM domain